MIFSVTSPESVAELFTREQLLVVRFQKSTAFIFLLAQLSDRFIVPSGP
jgi:hypothetical protein